MNWKLRFLLWFVNNVQPLKEVDIEFIEQERRNKVKVSQLGKLLFDSKKEIQKIEDISIEGIPVRIYNNSLRPDQSAIIYFHGGGFVYYNIESHDYVTRRLCSMNDCVVISVDYKLAPEYSYPAAHSDAYTVIEYISKHAKQFNINPLKIIVAGDSAGGNLAACVSLNFRNHPFVSIAGQVLIYPWLDGKIESNSIEKYKEGFLLTKKAMLWFQEVYTPNIEDRLDPGVSPIYHKDFSNQPPTFIITAEYDPLKDEGKMYADKLKAAGNIVLYKDYKKLVHGFFNIPKISDESMQAYYDIQAFLKKIL